MALRRRFTAFAAGASGVAALTGLVIATTTMASAHQAGVAGTTQVSAQSPSVLGPRPPLGRLPLEHPSFGSSPVFRQADGPFAAAQIMSLTETASPFARLRLQKILSIASSMARRTKSIKFEKDWTDAMPTLNCRGKR